MTEDAHERFRRDYAPAFLQYLSERDEPGRRAAYELGRRAITEQLSVLDLTRIHHAMLLEVLRTHRTPRELEHIAQAASEFLVEALAVFEMTQRGFAELLATARSDQEQRRQTDERPQQRTGENAEQDRAPSQKCADGREEFQIAPPHGFTRNLKLAHDP